ncbi:MAG: hypothetical protein PVF07_08075 [Thiogranum sp.]|jgi:hypothetical protein
MKNPRRRNRWIMGTFVGTAAIAVAIDHTRHRLPEPLPLQHSESAPTASTVIIVDGDTDSPCSLETSPCSLDENPCSLDQPAAGMDDSPCSL